MTTVEHKYFTVEGDPVIVGELYERRDGVVEPCQAIDRRANVRYPVEAGFNFDSYTNSGRFYSSFVDSPLDLMRRHVPAVEDHSGDGAEMVQAVADAIADALFKSDDNAHLGDIKDDGRQTIDGRFKLYDIARAAIAAVREFEGKSDGK